MYIWLITPNLSFDDWKIEVMWSFMDSLSMMVDGWPSLYYFLSHESIVGLIFLLECLFMLLLVFDPYGLTLTPHKPSNGFTLVHTFSPL